MAQQITIDIVADVQKLKQGVDQANKQLGGLDASAKKVQGLTTAFAGVAVAAKGFSVAGGFINEATDAASSLEETLSKSKVIFGESAEEVEKFASGAADAIGQSKQAALDAASNFAIFGKSAGLSGEELVNFCTDFVALGSDLASFNDTTPEEAINAIGSALRGESEPLRKYGVLINDAALKQAALELGLIKTTKAALTPQQKVLAAQKLIYEQTTAAQGDFERTSDGLANSTRKLEANQTDLNAEIGERFLPFMKRVNDIVLGAVEFFGRLPGPIQNIVIGLGLFLAVAGPLLILISAIKTAIVALGIATKAKTAITALATTAQWLFNAAMSANPIGLVILAIAAIIAIIVLLVKNWDTVTEVVGKVWDAIKNFAKDAWNAIKGFGSRIEGFVQGVISDFKALPGAMLNVGKDIIYGIWNGIQSLAGWLKTKVFNFFGNLVPSWAKKVLGIGSPSKVFARYGRFIVEGLATGIERSADLAKAATEGLGLQTIGAFPTNAIPRLQGGALATSSPINITSNAGAGADPYSVRRAVTSAIDKYSRISSATGQRVTL